MFFLILTSFRSKYRKLKKKKIIIIHRIFNCLPIKARYYIDEFVVYRWGLRRTVDHRTIIVPTLMFDVLTVLLVRWLMMSTRQMRTEEFDKKPLRGWRVETIHTCCYHVSRVFILLSYLRMIFVPPIVFDLFYKPFGSYRRQNVENEMIIAILVSSMWTIIVITSGGRRSETKRYWNIWEYVRCFFVTISDVRENRRWAIPSYVFVVIA